MALTSFDDWTCMLDLDDFEEIDSLYQSVNTVSEFGLFKTVNGKSNGTYVVTASYAEGALYLASEKARQAFLKFIEDKYCDGESEPIWYAVERANSKDD